MNIHKVQQEYLFVSLPYTSSFFIRLNQLGDIWLFNCLEGCQHILNKNKVKISQIKKIIITDNNINNISGLLGLLSSISLNTNTDRIDLYATEELYKYIFWGRKYSQTNFRYELYIHKVLDGLILCKSNIKVYGFSQYNKIRSVHYSIILSESPGPFNSLYAFSYNIPFGPLYGYFKIGKNFILPDGFIAYSSNFISGYYLGIKCLFIYGSVPQKIVNILLNYNSLFYQ